MSLIVLLLSLAEAGAADLDVGTLGGAALSREGQQPATVARFAIGGLAGWAPVAPVRVELGFFSAGSSTPEGRAVTVSTWRGDLALLGGVAPTFLEPGSSALGFLVVAGPALRLSRTALGVYGDVERTTAATAKAAWAVGPWVRVWKLRIGLRAQGAVPSGHHTYLLGTVGFTP